MFTNTKFHEVQISWIASCHFKIYSGALWVLVLKGSSRFIFQIPLCQWLQMDHMKVGFSAAKCVASLAYTGVHATLAVYSEAPTVAKWSCSDHEFWNSELWKLRRTCENNPLYTV